MLSSLTILKSNTSETLFGIFMLDVNTAWVVGKNGTILKTTDGGDNWQPQTSGTTAFLRDVHFVDENRGWVVGDSATVLISYDGGATWAPEVSGVDNDLFETHFVNQNVGYAVGNDGIILKYTSSPTAVEEQAGPLPIQFVLFQNYPNPFNPETEIGFDLPEANRVAVRIFNTLGQEIRTLADSRYPAGRHSVRWDAKDKNGNPVSSGVYLYMFKAGSFTQMKKMTLIR